MTFFSLWSIFKARGGGKISEKYVSVSQKQVRKQLVDQDWDIVEICRFFYLEANTKTNYIVQREICFLLYSSRYKHLRTGYATNYFERRQSYF